MNILYKKRPTHDVLVTVNTGSNVSNVVVKNQVKYSTIHKVKDNHYHFSCQPQYLYGFGR